MRILVAPPAGAWIETLRPASFAMLRQSRPPRARGLKQDAQVDIVYPLTVAPPAGAWIETESKAVEMICNLVAPPAGAWIETFLPSADAKSKA